MLRIYDTAHKLTHITTVEQDLKLEHDLATGDKTASFILPVMATATKHVIEEGYIRTKYHEFVVKEINTNFNTFQAIAVLNVEALEEKTYREYESITATIQECLEDTLVNTGWSIGFIEESVAKKRRTITGEKVNVWEIIQQVRKTYLVEIEFDTINKIINIFEKIGVDRGSYAREALNLTDLNIQSDSYQYYTRIYAEGKEGLTFTEINEGKAYVSNYKYSDKVKTYYWSDERYTIMEALLEDAKAKLEEMSKPKKSYSVDMINLGQDIRLGDTIEIVSKSNKIKEKQRVVKLIEYPNQPALNYVELSSTTWSIEELRGNFEEDMSRQVGDVTGAVTRLKQDTEKFQFEVRTSGGANLLRNGGFKSGDLTHWEKINNITAGEGQYWRVWTDRSYIPAGKHSLVIKGDNLVGEIGVSQRLKVRANSDYTLSLTASQAGANDVGIRVKSINGVLLEEKHWELPRATNDDTGAGYVRKNIVFNTEEYTEIIIELLLFDCGNNAFAFFTDVMLNEGSLALLWQPHSEEVYTVNAIIDKEGLTVQNGAIKIQNKAGETVLEGDVNGNLTLTGTIKTENTNGAYASLNTGGLTLKDSNKDEQVLRVGTSFFTANRDINGVNFAQPQYSDYMRFSHIAKDDLENGWATEDTQFNYLDFWSSDATINNTKYFKGVNIFAPLYMRNTLKVYNRDTSHTSDIFSSSWNGQVGLLALNGDNGVILGYKAGETYKTKLVVTEENVEGTADTIMSWGNWNANGWTIHNATFRGNFVNSYANQIARRYSETNCIEAEERQIRVNYKDIQIKEGKAILNIPRRFDDMYKSYIVNSIVKKGAGDVWVETEEYNRFTIRATADIKINVEIILEAIEETTSLATAPIDPIDDLSDIQGGILNEAYKKNKIRCRQRCS